MMTLLSMGGYALYVWPAYGITLFVLSFNLIRALRTRKKIKKSLVSYFNQASNE